VEAHTVHRDLWLPPTNYPVWMTIFHNVFLNAANAMRVIWREGAVGLMNGLAFAIILGGLGVFWTGDPRVGVVLSAAMIINMLIAGLSGILIPLVLDRLKFDPALSSAVFVTTVTDVVGFFAFLGLAAVVFGLL